MGGRPFTKPGIAQQLRERHVRERPAFLRALEDQLTIRVQRPAFRKISRQRPLKGTRWAFRDFMRSLGMIQIAFQDRISDQAASRVSLLRVAVRIKNSNASRVVGHPFWFGC